MVIGKHLYLKVKNQKSKVLPMSILGLSLFQFKRGNFCRTLFKSILAYDCNKIKDLLGAMKKTQYLKMEILVILPKWVNSFFLLLNLM